MLTGCWVLYTWQNFLGVFKGAQIKSGPRAPIDLNAALFMIWVLSQISFHLERDFELELFMVYKGVSTKEKLAGWKKLSNRIWLCRYIVVQCQGWVRWVFDQEIISLWYQPHCKQWTVPKLALCNFSVPVIKFANFKLIVCMYSEVPNCHPLCYLILKNFSNPLLLLGAPAH